MHLLDFLFRRRPREHIAHIDESILVAADVDESGLQRRQDVLDRPLVDMIDDVHVVIAFDGEIAKTAIFQDRHARFFWHDIAYDCFHLLIPPVRTNS